MDPTEATAGDTEPTADASDTSDTSPHVGRTDHRCVARRPAHTAPWWGPLTIVAFVALVVCTNVANAVFAAWVDDHPAGLLALSSRQRYLALRVRSAGSASLPTS